MDVYRQVHPTMKNKYSWYGYMINYKMDRRNGLRLDYFICDVGLLEMVRGCDILNNVVGSDHCPVHLLLELLNHETVATNIDTQEIQDKSEAGMIAEKTVE